VNRGRFEGTNLRQRPGTPTENDGMKALLLGALTLLACSTKSTSARENWPELRGPEQNGHSEAKKLPLAWSETNNVAWKSAIHDLGWSSPVVWGDQIWITTATEDGKHVFAVCVNSQTGKIVHDIKVFDTETPEHVASVSSYGQRRRLRHLPGGQNGQSGLA
jgi:outer membrane protein assembly factor BamB